MRAVPGEGKPASQRAGAESMRAQRAEFENEEPKLAAQIRSLQRELEEKRAGENTLDKAATGGAAEFLQNKKLLRGLRKTDNGSPEKRYE
jgi:hypothetical protein